MIYFCLRSKTNKTLKRLRGSLAIVPGHSCYELSSFKQHVRGKLVYVRVAFVYLSLAFLFLIPELIPKSASGSDRSMLAQHYLSLKKGYSEPNLIRQGNL